ncbi:hypothetical protein MMC10_001334 [Thelotrema lepadinum]|nr:hypothetical protein [Thelotrema lepadinum]
MPLKPVPSLVGVCVRHGTMDKAVKVRTTKQKLDTFMQKVLHIPSIPVPPPIQSPFPPPPHSFPSVPSLSPKLTPTQNFKLHPTYLLHDPHNSVRTGDIVRFQRFPIPTPSKRIKHMVTEIISAHGPRIEERPALLSPDERKEIVAGFEERAEEKKRRKVVAREEKIRWREEARRRAWEEVRRVGKVKRGDGGGEGGQREGEREAVR